MERRGGSEMGLEGWEVGEETRFKIKLGLGYICAKMNSKKQSYWFEPISFYSSLKKKRGL